MQFGINKDEISFQRLNSCNFTYFVESNVAMRNDHQTLLKKIKDVETDRCLPGNIVRDIVIFTGIAQQELLVLDDECGKCSA